MKPLNLIGHKFGRLTITERIGSLGGKSRWLGVCKCGGTAKATAHNLTWGFVTSCGCFRREFIRGNQLPNGESGFNTLFYDYRKRAEEKQLPFTLSKEEFRGITQKICFYCGKAPLQLGFPNRKNKTPYIYNGVDRIDNAKGYVLENCAPCCSVCNYMKGDMTPNDFADTIGAIFRNTLRQAAEIVKSAA